MTPGNGTVAVVAGATVASYLPLFLLGALAVQMQQDLGYGPSAQGALVSTFNLTVAIAAIPLSRLADGLGWTRSISAASVALAIGMLAIAAGVTTWTALAVVLILCAIANSLVLPSGNIAIVDAVPLSQRGLAFGVRQAAVPLAVVLGGLAVPLIAIPLGWRPVFALAAGVPAAVAILITRRWHRTGTRQAHMQSRRPPITAPLLALFALNATGALLVNSANAFFAMTAVDGGIAPGMTGILLVLGSGIALVVRLAAGLLVDRHPNVQGFGVIASLLACGMTGFLLIATGHRAAIAVGVALGVGVGTGWPGVVHYVISNEHPAHVGGLSSMMLTCANVGGFVGPLAFGLIVDHASYRAAWTFLGVSAAGGVGCVLGSGRGFAAQRRSQAGASGAQ